MGITNIDINEVDVLSRISPKVSIVVATYRRKESLEKSIRSLLAQNYDNYEIIIVDDNASKEWNAEVEKIINKLNKLYNTEIIYSQNECNKGSAITRNIGIEIATGEYITFLDDDDIYLPLKIKEQVEDMIRKEADFSLTDLWLYDENDKLIEKRVRDYIKDFSRDSLVKYHLLFHMTGTDVMMFKKQYLIDIGMFSPISVGDEFYLMMKAIDGKGVFSYLPGCEVKAYVHSETDGLSSGTGKIKGENELYEFKRRYFYKLTKKEQRYIRMRHFAVIAYAEFRMKRYFPMIKNVLFSYIQAPIELMALFIKRK